jgi:benzoate-CoA ligase family protein
VISDVEVPTRFNVASWFVDRNVEEGRGERVALYVGDREVTYAELAALINRTGHGLRELGLRPGERVLLALGDGAEFVASWYAALKIGAVVAEVYTFLRPKDYGYFLGYTEARVAIVDRTTLEAFREVAPQCPSLDCVLVVGVPAEELREGEVAFDALLTTASAELEPATTDPDALAIWKFTTGTTGAPKAAVHRARDPYVSFQCYARGVLDLREDDLVLPIPKLFFGYARDLTALFNFGVGAAGIAFPERTTPERLFTLIERHRPTVLVQVPTMMNEMSSHPEAWRHDLGSLRICVSSGEALPVEVHRRWLEVFGGEVLEGIGSSEAYHIFISHRPGRVRAGSAGLIVPGYEAKIVDDDGGELGPNEPGELWVAGDSIAVGYWGDEEKSRRTFDGPWIHTGDIFERDGEGYFTYRGRGDDLLKVGGIWVAPAEIENCLIEHPAVREAAVVGYEMEGLTYPRAWVVLRKGTGDETTAHELTDFVRERLSPHKYPRDIRFLEELPRTATGKVDRKPLRMAGPGDENPVALAGASRAETKRERG